MFFDLGGKMELYDCTIYTEVQDSGSTTRIEAPRMLFESEFINFINGYANSSEPAKIKISRMIPVFDSFEATWINREVHMAYANNAYIAKNGEGNPI